MTETNSKKRKQDTPKTHGHHKAHAKNDVEKEVWEGDSRGGAGSLQKDEGGVWERAGAPRNYPEAMLLELDSR